MTISFRIRKMRREDWDEYHKLDSEIFPDDMTEREPFMRRLEKEGFFALEVEDRLAGTLRLNIYGDEGGHLASIGVAKRHQGKGFGKALMQYALDWFRERGVTHVHLYTQDFNTTAQGLYRRFGFEVSGTTWSYSVPYPSISPSGSCACQRIREEEIDRVAEKYPDALPASQIRRFLSSDRYVVLTLKDGQHRIIGAGRFTPSFPGCFPFLLDDLECFDDFIAGIKQFSQPEFDYVRIIFTDYPDLARLCEQRGYKLHHRLYRMELDIG